MGYSLADTALVALISRYASPATQGRSMGLNQAAQSLSRVVSPVVSSRVGYGRCLIKRIPACCVERISVYWMTSHVEVIAGL